MSDLRDVIAKPIEETMRGWFQRNWTIVDGNLSNACAEAVIAAIAASGAIVMDRARFDRLAGIAVDCVGEIVYSGVSTEEALTRCGLQPGDLEPLP